MVCKLCLLEKDLLKRSHVIPDFLYKELYGDKHRLVNVKLDNLQQKKYQQTGIYEKDILCKECDNIVLGSLERYASNTIYNVESPKFNVNIEEFAGDNIHLPFTRFSGLDYANIKLFFLSILWRAHLSRDPFFKEVDLGNFYESKIRKMIFEHNPGDEDEFEVVLVSLRFDGTRPTKSTISPVRIKEGINTMYVFHINGVMYHFNVSPIGKEPMFEKGLIKKDGILDIGFIEGDFGRGYFDGFTGKPLLMKSNPVR